MMIAGAVVGEKMKGFSRKETVTYYERLSKKPGRGRRAQSEVRAEKYSEAADWTMWTRIRHRTAHFRSARLYAHWWWRADPYRRLGRRCAHGGSVSRGGVRCPRRRQIHTVTLPAWGSSGASVIGSVSFSTAWSANLASSPGGPRTRDHRWVQPSSTFRGGGGGGGHSIGGAILRLRLRQRVCCACRRRPTFIRW